ncbi:MAG: radical SAM protein [Clostridia bacterium]|nr:radical SAM protein [Clostridia bacterium]
MKTADNSEKTGALCALCPRKCLADRTAGRGYCGCGSRVMIARAALHEWEEPCITGGRGAGAVFFCGCPLHCVYCQNSAISGGAGGREVTPERLKAIFARLIKEGAYCIDLVSPTQYSDVLADVLSTPLPVPVVWNSGGYDAVGQLKALEGRIDIYMPDFKYSDGEVAAKYSRAPDYPEVALAAIREMYRQTGPARFDKNGNMLGGVIIRHLVLPGELENTFGVMDAVSSEFPRGEVVFSLMSQYTPCGGISGFENLQRRLTPGEYRRAVDYMYLCGIDLGYMQELSSAKEEYIPPFDLTGV